MDQTKKVKTKKKVFSTKISTNSGCRLKILAKPRILKCYPHPPKKMSSSQKFYEIRCESTKTTKKQFLLANSRAVNTDLKVLGLDLHSSGPELVNFFGAQSSLRGHTSSHLGGNGPGMPPLALGLRYVGHEDEIKDGQPAESR